VSAARELRKPTIAIENVGIPTLKCMLYTTCYTERRFDAWTLLVILKINSIYEQMSNNNKETLEEE